MLRKTTAYCCLFTILTSGCASSHQTYVPHDWETFSAPVHQAGLKARSAESKESWWEGTAFTWGDLVLIGAVIGGAWVVTEAAAD